MTRAQRFAVAASGALVVGVAAVVLLFGVVTPPELPDIAGGPKLPQPVALLTPDGRDECVTIIAPSGEARRGACFEDGAGILDVSEEHGLVLERFVGAGEVFSVLDPVSGEVVDTIESSGGRDEPLDQDGPGAVLVEEADGEQVVRYVRGDDDRELLRLEAPREYRLYPGRHAPAGPWVLLTDSADRVIVASLEGRGAWLLVDDGRDPLWVPVGAR